VSASSDLVVHLARFARELRASGVEVGVGDEVDATRALTMVDLGDRDEVRVALRVALKIKRRDWDAFDGLYRQFWTGALEPGKRVARVARSRPAVLRSPRSGGETLRLQEVDPDVSRSATEGDRPGYSPELLLRRKPFDDCSAADLAAMEQVLQRLVPRLATRRSRRLVPAPARGIADVRRSLRRAVATGGELVSLARRQRAREQPELLVLCDTSGSMDPHTRFLLAFVMSLKRVARRTEVFAFNTSLTRLTPWLVPGKVARTLEHLAAGVPDWAGGTKIGECLADFVTRYAGELVTGRTVVVIFSDGLDRGDTTLVAEAMRAIRAKARRVVWLNPLCGDPRYEPTARAMQAALPFVDRLAAAHNLESLERILPELSA
jgi:uncharacterized protein with von Willebrand factor type A (vWA) domain